MGEDDLLEDIYASPNDDGPRLVYADALTAKGDPRGELIVLQCRLEAAPDDEARSKLKVAENKLLRARAREQPASIRKACACCVRELTLLRQARRRSNIAASTCEVIC